MVVAFGRGERISAGTIQLSVRIVGVAVPTYLQRDPEIA